MNCAAAALIFALGVAGAELPEFTVHQGNKKVVFAPTKAKATVVVFTSTICPISDVYVERLDAMFKTYSAKGVQFAIVNSNSNEDAAQIRKYTRANKIAYPIYKDLNNALADNLKAQSTPEAVVLDPKGAVVYQGGIDDSANGARVRVNNLRDAIDAVLSENKVAQPETKPFGCTIKRADAQAPQSK